MRWRAAVARAHVESGFPHLHPRRHPLNVPGAFYTTGNCMACGAPEERAPDLLAPLTGENWITHFVRQPETPAEIERACSACEACCVEALRYGGTDPLVIRRLGNDPGYCDYQVRPDSPAVVPAGATPPVLEPTLPPADQPPAPLPDPEVDHDESWELMLQAGPLGGALELLVTLVGIVALMGLAILAMSVAHPGQ